MLVRYLVFNLGCTCFFPTSEEEPSVPESLANISTNYAV